MNKMIIHYCGGAGINISKKIHSELANLGEGFCEVEPRYIDTSVNNIGGLPPELLWKIDSSGFSEGEIAGSGGERRTNSTEIVEDMKKYLDTHGHTDEVTSEFHVVVFSASGGTGSIVAPTIMSNLRTRNIPVLGVVIGDSGNGLSCKNTLNTIATLDHMSKTGIKKPMVIIYYNNHNAVAEGAKDREDLVNSKILSALTITSLFLSGDNEDIDTKDMINFLAPDNYNTISIAPSLYCINMHIAGEVTNNKEHINLIGRTLSCPKDHANLDLVLLQHKYGMVTSQNAIDKMDELTPIHVVLAGNCLVEEHKALKNTVAEYTAIMDGISTATLEGTGDADDSGMVF
ncbi:MAG: hypothetical protein Q9M19_01050 [Mariprofundaceae bacterium]|nr:hypothetical protein [Mariprofundaceae bacterium]